MTDADITLQNTPDISRTLQQLQKALLARGYTYLAGDVDAWPLTNVVMVKNERVLLIAIWDSSQAAAMRGWWDKIYHQDSAVGLLLVGSQPVNDEQVEQFFTATKGAMVYVDATISQCRLRRGTGDVADIMNETEMNRLLDPRESASSAEIDVRGVLQTHLARVAAQAADEQKSVGLAAHGTPYFTYAIIAACVLVFLGTLSSSGFAGLGQMPSEVLAQWGALYGPLVRLGEWWRIITSAFLHANAVHIGMNMLALYYFATPLESWIGRWRLAVIYFFSGITGALLSLWWSPNALCVGASGAIFGLLGAMAAILVRYQQEFPPKTRKSLYDWLKKLLIFNLIFSLIVPGISLSAHLGGLFGGFAMALIIARSPVNPAPLPKWASWALIALLVVTLMLATHIIKGIPLPQSS